MVKKTVEPKEEDGHDVHVYKEETIEGKGEPKYGCSTLKQPFQQAGTGIEAPGQLRLPSREMQQTAVDSCTHADGMNSSELSGIFSFEVVVGMKFDISPQFTTRQKFVTLPMS